MKRVLFICTRNSARSQMAEGLVNHDLAGRFKAFSAGTDPSAIHPLAIEAMQEVGEDENMKLEHRLSYIAIIGTVSPMVGLLGTVDGMIQSFSEIAIRSTAPART